MQIGLVGGFASQDKDNPASFLVKHHKYSYSNRLQGSPAVNDKPPFFKENWPAGAPEGQIVVWGQPSRHAAGELWKQQAVI